MILITKINPQYLAHLNIYNLSYSYYEEEEKMNISDPDMSDSDMLESITSLICNYCGGKVGTHQHCLCCH